MKRLHLFLIKSFLGPFIATFFIAIFLLLMQFLWKYIDDLVGKGLEFTQIAELIFYASARFVPVALPIAMLLASVMVFGKLGENYELVALKSSGISLIRILLPLTIFVIIISYGSFLFSNYDNSNLTLNLQLCIVYLKQVIQYLFLIMIQIMCIVKVYFRPWQKPHHLSSQKK